MRMDQSLTSRPLLSTSFICLSAAVVLLPFLSRAFSARPPRIIRSPRDTLLSLSQSELSSLTYPPNILPGGRDVPTPYGTIKVFEFGPVSGERVLLLPGLSTPSLSMTNLAEALAEKGYRVMLLDYFGRGWSDGPDPGEVDHDERLYASQILMAVASSEVSWTGGAGRAGGGGGGGGFHIVGYSFGGGLAVNFASWFPHLVRSVTAVAPGGLVSRRDHSWRTRLLYSRGLLPERLLQHFVRRRFEPVFMTDEEGIPGGGGGADAGATLVGGVGLARTGRVTGDPFDDTVMSPRRPGVTVAEAVAWQLRHHEGFVPAVMSSLRYGPVYERYEEWRRLGSLLFDRRKDPSLPGLLGGKILLVLGSSDFIVKEEDIVPDLKDTLGEDAFEVEVLDAGHEVVMTKGAEVADVASGFWKKVACSAD